jgi:hypothetical protein
MPSNASGRQPSPESCRPGKDTTITTKEIVPGLIDRNLLHVNWVDLNRRDSVTLARLSLFRDRLHRRRQNAILDEMGLDSAWAWRYRSAIIRLEHMAAALEEKGDQEAAKTLLERVEFLRLQIKSIHSTRAAKRREFEESERRHRDRQRALDDEIFAGLHDEILAHLRSLDDGRPS